MDTKRDDGGQAFPMIDVQIDGQAIGSAGMSLRDWFAGQALAGLMQFDGTGLLLEKSRSDAAMASYAIADAMIETRAE